jgi:hypothetical protein
MNRILLGTICGVIFGIVAIQLMIPLEFEDKRRAMLGAFINRFTIGLVIGASILPVPSWLQGLLLGLLLSLPDAIITKALLPILGIGIAGGLVIGIVVGLWGI